LCHNAQKQSAAGKAAEKANQEAEKAEMAEEEMAR
jgi:hypothetical protein